jgi:4-amino-4-deoxy-L-arabinose transferase-like glycosyltransferase/Tfp pilus assembly protein PilF
MKDASARPHSSHRVWLWLLLAVVGLALLLRVLNLAALAGSPLFTRPMIDGRAYDQWAVQITQGKAPHEPFYQDPLYPYFLAAIYSVFGHSYWAVYLVQLLLGLGTVLLVFDTTRRVFDRRAGVVAALVAALYGPFIFYESQIEKTVLAVFLVALLLWLLVRGVQHKGHQGPMQDAECRVQHAESKTRKRSGIGEAVWWALGTGIALGLAVLTRANLLVFAPLLPAVFYFMSAGGRQAALRNAAVSLLGVIVVIAPVAIRNSSIAREFTLTTTQGGQNLYIGNCEYNRVGQYVVLPWVRPHPDFEQTDFRDYANKAAGRRLSYSGVSSFYASQAIKWATTHFSGFLVLFGRKLQLYISNYEVPDNQDVYFFARYSWVLRLPLLTFGIVFGLGLAGMILLLRRNRVRLLLVLFFAGYALTVVVFFVFSRYRIPALPALLPFVGGLVVWLWERRPRTSPNAECRMQSAECKGQVVEGRSPKAAGSKRLAGGGWRSAAGGLLLAMAGAAVTLWPAHRSGAFETAQCLVNLAASYYHERDTTRAIATYHEALSIKPEQGEALRSLGTIAFERKDYPQALGLLRRAQKSEPASPAVSQYLGKTFVALQQLDSAYIAYARAIRLAPGRAEYRFELATILQKFGQFDAALAQYDTMIMLAPENPSVRHNHAVALYMAGRLQAAWDEMMTARRLGGEVRPDFEQMLRSAMEKPAEGNQPQTNADGRR